MRGRDKASDHVPVRIELGDVSAHHIWWKVILPSAPFFQTYQT